MESANVSLHEQWEELVSGPLLSPLSDLQKLTARSLFYAGAAAMFNINLIASEAPEDVATLILHSAHAELESFVQGGNHAKN